MWNLIKLSDNSHFWLPCNKDVVVGRKDVDLAISGDSSVSRKHGIIHITHYSSNLKNPDTIPTIIITDSSKFGTFITHPGNEKMKVNKTAVASSGDLIQFGAQNSIYKLQYCPFVVTSTMLESNVKQKLLDTMLILGGHMVNNCHEAVTHMVVEKIKLSIKVTQALVNGCHIVTPEFVWKISELLGKSGGIVPSPEDYLPELAEPNLSEEYCSFRVNDRRKTVFNGRTFVYLCKKQFKRLEQTVSGGGGESLLIDDPTITDDFLSKASTGIINCDINADSFIATNAQYERIQNILLQKDHRFIQEHEIGLAVLYCDAAVYCNPSFDLNSQNTFTQRPLEKTEPEASESQAMHSSDVGIKRRRSEQEEQPKADDLPEVSIAKRIKTHHTRELPVAEEEHAFQTNDYISDDVPDSCLDDDNLWSQNFDSAAFQPDKSIHQQITVNENIFGKETKMTIPANAVEASIIQPNDNREHHVQDNPLPEENHKHSKGHVVPINRSPIGHRKEKSSPHNPFVQISDTIPKNNHIEDIVKKELNQSNFPPPCDQKPSNGFDPAFPTNLSITDVVSLIVKRKRWVYEEANITSTIKNFKRFKKVWPTYMAGHMTQSDTESSHKFPPRIIGGSDFFVNEDKSNKSNDIGDWFRCESQSSEPFGKTSRRT